MNFYIDTEFMEDGHTITLLSLAAVTDTNEAFYGVTMDVDRGKSNAWVIKNVLPHLDTLPDEAESLTSLVECHGSRAQVGVKFLDWVSSFEEDPIFWANYGAYDWIAICQLYGDMSCLPDGWPMFCRDVQQEKNYPKQWLPRPYNPHHALVDAMNVKERLEYLHSLNEH